MKAFVIRQAGTLLVEYAEVPTPVIGPDELLVRVAAVGVGIHDSYFLPTDAHYPYPIGIEAAGTVDDIGREVTGFARGTRIAFVSSMQPKGGTWAEYVAVKSSSLIVKIPDALDFETAAALPVAANTALRAFSAMTAVPAGGSLFIAGGSGAIGTLAIQLARRRGWRVAASASEANHEYMRSLGAEKVVDYHDELWPGQILEWMPKGVDAVIAVQPGTSSESLRVAKDGGDLVTISNDAVATQRGVRISVVPFQADVRGELVQLFSEATAGDFHVELEHIYAFENALEALAKVQTRKARGKVILRLHC
ncbi:MAG: NADP-dependent oxidoreductase [Lacisediminihabitans sp.]